MAFDDFRSYLNNHKPSKVTFSLDYDTDYYGDYTYVDIVIQYYYRAVYDDDGSDWREISYDISRARSVIYDALSYANSRYGATVKINSIKELNTYDPD